MSSPRGLNNSNSYRGKLKLNHDLTPRDLSNEISNENISKDNENYRYRGYPGGNFVKPRDPVLGLTEEEGLRKAKQNELTPWYGLNHPFDTRGANHIYKDHRGLKYGTNGASKTTLAAEHSQQGKQLFNKKFMILTLTISLQY